jgi:hypothetical protein
MLILTGEFVLAPIALAQIAPLQGNVVGTNGRPLQWAEVRVEATDRPSAPITTTTGSDGRFLFTGLPAGFYRLSVLEAGAVRFSVKIKMRGEKARIDFDLSPPAGKEIRNYVWVPSGTGSHLSGHWVEKSAARIPRTDR